MRFDSLRTSRRSFLKGVAVTAGGLYLPNILHAQEGVTAGKKVGVACIGCGGKGYSDMEGAAKDNEIVALCDVDAKNLAKAAAKYPNARQFTDFRKMLDEVKEIEAVTVSTPDHAHYPAAMHAIALGKHVCVQKPLTNTLWEARQLHEAAKKKGVITQMGNQGHTFEGNRQLKEWVAAGILGKIKEGHVWTNRPIWPQGKEVSFKEGVVPDTLDWKQWLAATPDRAYSPDIHPFKWRGFIEYGAGALGDMGCHIMDAIFWSLDLGMPQKIEAKTDELSDVAWPRGATVKYTWNNAPKIGEFVLYWYEGKDAEGKPTKPVIPTGYPKTELGAGGFILVGSEGTVVNEGDQAHKRFNAEERSKLTGKPPAEMVLLPDERAKYLDEHPVEKTLPRSPREGAPQQEWTLAIKEGKPFPFMSQFDYSVPLTELCLLGALAMRCGRPIEWNSAKFEVTGMPEAAAYIKRAQYREGWEYSAAKI